MVQADTYRIAELTRFLSASEDADLWLNVITNQHMLPNGVTVGKAVLMYFFSPSLGRLIPEEPDLDKSQVLINHDYALWFRLFPTLKVVHPLFAADFIRKRLTLENVSDNQEKVLK